MQIEDGNTYDPEDFQVFTIKEENKFQVFLVQGSDICWKCGEKTSVIGFFLPYAPPEDTPEEREMYRAEIAEFKNGMEELGGFPPWITCIMYIDDDDCPFERKTIDRISNKYPFWHKDFSKSIEEEYYMNHCEICSANQGDYYLHCESDSCFFYFPDWYGRLAHKKKIDPSTFEEI